MVKLNVEVVIQPGVAERVDELALDDHPFNSGRNNTHGRLCRIDVDRQVLISLFPLQNLHTRSILHTSYLTRLRRPLAPFAE